MIFTWAACAAVTDLSAAALGAFAAIFGIRLQIGTDTTAVTRAFSTAQTIEAYLALSTGIIAFTAVFGIGFEIDAFATTRGLSVLAQAQPFFTGRSLGAFVIALAAVSRIILDIGALAITAAFILLASVVAFATMPRICFEIGTFVAAHLLTNRTLAFDTGETIWAFLVAGAAVGGIILGIDADIIAYDVVAGTQALAFSTLSASLTLIAATSAVLGICLSIDTTTGTEDMAFRGITTHTTPFIAQFGTCTVVAATAAVLGIGL